MPVRTGAIDAFLARNKQVFEDIGVNPAGLQFSMGATSPVHVATTGVDIVGMARRCDFPASITGVPPLCTSMVDGIPARMVQAEATARKARLATAIPLAVILALHALVFWPW